MNPLDNNRQASKSIHKLRYATIRYGPCKYIKFLFKKYLQGGGCVSKTNFASRNSWTISNQKVYSIVDGRFYMKFLQFQCIYTYTDICASSVYALLVCLYSGMIVAWLLLKTGDDSSPDLRRIEHPLPHLGVDPALISRWVKKNKQAHPLRWRMNGIQWFNKHEWGQMGVGETCSLVGNDVLQSSQAGPVDEGLLSIDNAKREVVFVSTLLTPRT